MATIYKFQDSETALTSTTTNAVITSADPVLVYSNALGRASQVTVGAVSAVGVVTSATSLTTATQITAYGLTKITSNPITSYTLADPLTAGLVKTIVMATSTSTATVVTPVSATFLATDASSGASLVFSKPGAIFQIESLSTAVWIVTGRTVAGTLCT